MRAIEVRNLSYRYPGQSDYALLDLNLNVDEGEIVLLTGPSGCGKSSLIRCINGLIPQMYGGQYEGEVRVLGLNPAVTPTRVMSKHVGTVFQNPDNQLFALSVEGDVAFSLENLGLQRDDIEKRVREALERVGISELRKRSTFELSGGQKQKVAIASILALSPKILLLDEPTSSLDPLSARSLIETLVELRRRDELTVMIAEHKTELLAPIADKMVVMDNGTVIDEGHPREVIERAIRFNYAINVPKVSQLSALLSEYLNSSIYLEVRDLVDALSEIGCSD
ncbi:MAG: energy-coupling factor ABC transporter ATP-binding protein [Aigarchaeota archaeon]|nr:energy-coupling factor ABC transporter ATP-binding protein [Aigarchaeota archaeon]MDW8092432.1 ABC transporter ATP-binding protein [Nitrososphaerota archaeon]